MNAWHSLSFALGSLLAGKPPRRRPSKAGRGPKRRGSQRRQSSKTRRHGNHRPAGRSPAGRQPAKRGPATGGARRGREIVAYHGTDTVANARSMVRDGWMIGNGNLLGDGVYFARDFATAKGYAGSGGLVVKCRIRTGRQARQSAALGRELAQWCRRRGVANDNSARTAYLLQQGYDTLIDGRTIVVLAPRYANPSAWKHRIRGIKILSVHRASNGSRVHV